MCGRARRAQEPQAATSIEACVAHMPFSLSMAEQPRMTRSPTISSCGEVDLESEQRAHQAMSAAQLEVSRTPRTALCPKEDSGLHRLCGLPASCIEGKVWWICCPVGNIQAQGSGFRRCVHLDHVTYASNHSLPIFDLTLSHRSSLALMLRKNRASRRSRLNLRAFRSSCFGLA